MERDLAPWYAQTWKAGRRDGSLRMRGVSAIRADGYLGQYLFVYPAERLVVVRLRHAPRDASRNEAGSFKTIEAEIERLLSRPKEGG